jgi:UDPglucose 6-dehydrogenase
MKISIIGTGYVGLVTGACLAEHGHDVVCVDVDESKVAAINAGRAPIHEDGLEPLLKKHCGTKLRATTDLPGAVAPSDVTFIAVGTPFGDGAIDLRFVRTCAEQLGDVLKTSSRYHTIVVKSTVVPGTCDGVVRPILEARSGKRAGKDFGLGVNPEFLTEGTAVRDFLSPDRLVIGGIDDRARAAIEAVYTGFPGVPRILTNNSTAELIKYASNALLATMISFANEIGRVASAVGGIDVADVQRGVHASTYLTSKDSSGAPLKANLASFLEAGCGFGGSCLPKDVAALASRGKELGIQTPMLDSVLAVNRGQPDVMIGLLRKHYPSLQGVRVAVLGLAFKPDTDDVRESPAFPIIARLQAAGASVVAYDPVAMEQARPRIPQVTLAPSLEQAVQGAEAILLVTRWEEFRRVPALVRSMKPAPLFVDGRRLLAPAEFERYEGIGR